MTERVYPYPGYIPGTAAGSPMPATALKADNSPMPHTDLTAAGSPMPKIEFKPEGSGCLPAIVGIFVRKVSK